MENTWFFPFSAAQETIIYIAPVYAGVWDMHTHLIPKVPLEGWIVPVYC